jgi:DeoR/GlpR family transcriptional regulator of sugar metabolism
MRDHFLSVYFVVKALSIMPDNLFPEERRAAILDQLRSSGRVSVKALSDSLNVSEVTIRQDLQLLEEGGYLYRTYGGAMLRREITTQSDLAFDLRMNKNREEKNALGKAVAGLVKDGYGIALDASTTVCSIIPYLGHLSGLTAVTNNLLVAQQLLAFPQIEVLLPSGRLRRDANSIVGNPESLPEINLNIGFFSAWGISLGEGLTEVDAAEMMMKQALLARCISKIVLVDSSKWGKVAPYTFDMPQNMTRIYTTSSAPSSTLQQFKQAGIPVEVVE